MTISERLSKVKELRACFNCLRRGHRLVGCPSKNTCSKCRKRHHTLLHIESTAPFDVSNTTLPSTSSEQFQVKPNLSSDEKPKSGSPVQTQSISSSCSVNPKKVPLPNVLLLTAVVNVMDRDGRSIPCRAFIDCGAQTNLISSEMFRKLGLDCVSVNVDILGVSGVRSKANRLVSVIMSSQCTDYKTTLKCLVVPRITSQLPCKPVDIKNWNIPPELRLADPGFHSPSEVDLLIGITHFFALMKPGQFVIDEGLPVFCETELGWVVSGEVNDKYESIVHARSVNTVTIESLSEMMKRFWELEEVEETKPNVEEQECEEIFRRSHRRDDSGRFIVDLPFRENVNLLDDNRSSALRRFLFLEKRLQRNPELHQLYSKFIEEYESLGHCKEVQERLDPPGKLVYYLPHHAVLRPTSSSTKLRVVFDASAKSNPSVKALNEVLYVGPVVQNDLLTILLHFRRFRFAFTADIAKMYRQILVNPSQTSAQRIFWRSHPNEGLRVLQLQTVTYGTSSAPFLATRSLVQLCEDEGSQFPHASRIVLEDCYVDDIISGADSIEEAIECQHQLRSLLSRGCFPIHKWCANNEAIFKDIPDQEREKLVHLNQISADQVIKTLRLIWNPSSDKFLFTIDPIADDNPVTKKRLFSIVAKLFDPLGFLSPTIVIAKRLMQRTWATKLEWDCPLGGDLLETWSQFSRALQKVNEVEIPRPVLVSGSRTIELHGFADAWAHAYGACLYVRSIDSDGNSTVLLLCAKSKIAPLKEMTIPRKELCAAQLPKDFA
ncbi:uncharacterized protein LOC128740119 [Sabethes cyaneus]|uniref:uncharacterized protein LOC128740119 n=1 Tax=Sabethes cyaneus TaxID=53552 RepID=UPI00237E887E|nr:uncharacterized protein LOC128740119 [Sabethes cyaneus]